MSKIVNEIIRADSPETAIRNLHPSVSKLRWLAKQMGKDSFMERTKEAMIFELSSFILEHRRI